MHKTNGCLIVLSLALLSCDVAPPGVDQSSNENGEGIVDGDSSDTEDNTPPHQSPDPDRITDPAQLKQLAGLAVESAAGVALVAITARDIQPIFEWGVPEPDCPQLVAELAGRDLRLSFEFGDGCSATHAPAHQVRGRARGIYYTAYNAFDFALEDVAVNGATVRGLFTGRIDSSAEQRQLALHLNTEHPTMRLSGTVQVTPTATAIHLAATELTVTNSDGVVYTITDLEAEIPLNTVGGLLPIGGTASIAAAADDASPPTVITFAP